MKENGAHKARRSVKPSAASEKAALTVAASGDSVTNLAAYARRRAELRAWAAAVLHLQAQGLPAAAPRCLLRWLRRHGIEAGWYHRNPCHTCPVCGSHECLVLSADGESPPPEAHFCLPVTGTGAW